MRNLALRFQTFCEKVKKFSLKVIFKKLIKLEKLLKAIKKSKYFDNFDINGKL